jgi:aryl-alcohol dehydrogenase-like predicted oxidoreductase
MFGDNWKGFMGSTSDEDIEKIISKYYEVGGNFIDTANVYQYGQSEEKIGK